MVGIDWGQVAIVAGGAVAVVLFTAVVARLLGFQAKQVVDPPSGRVNDTFASGNVGGVSEALGIVPVSVAPWRPEVQLILECDPLQQWNAYSKTYHLRAAGDRYLGEQGTKQSKWWDRVQLIVYSDSTFVLVGEYTEGDEVIKQMKLTGSVTLGFLQGQGMRGRRTCRIAGQMHLKNVI